MKNVRVILGALIIFATAAFAASQNGKKLKFTEFLIAGNYGYPYGLQVADIDKDGDIDITSVDTDNEIYWYENDGKGNFTRHFIQVNETGGPERHFLGDIDGDGDIDLMAAMNIEGDFVWFENQGDSNKLWKRHVAARYGASSFDPDIEKKIHTGDGLVGRTALDCVLVDFDGDGDLDAGVSTWVGNFLAWLENTGNPRSNFIGRGFRAHMIEENCGETRTARAADFDKDGHVDFLGCSRTGSFLAWYQNPGTLPREPFIKHIISTLPSPVYGEPVDMDKDGDSDVVITHNGPDPNEDQMIVWYENTPECAKENWPMHVIKRGFYDAQAVIPGDIDGDGDIDVVATSHRGPGKVAVLYNPGDAKSTDWPMQIIKNNWNSANCVLVADFNKDGRLDILAGADRGTSEVRWWRNDGTAEK